MTSNDWHLQTANAMFVENMSKIQMLHLPRTEAPQKCEEASG